MAILVTWPLTVKGQAFCMKHSDFVAEVAREFQERLVGFGILSDKQVIGLFASSRGSGNNWQHVSPPLPDMKIFYPG